MLVNGARQAGKSTLVRAVAGERTAEWRDLDRPQDRQSALADDDFLLGVVFYTGDSTLPFGPKLRAMPVSALWQLH